MPLSKTATVHSNARRLAVEYHELEEVYITFFQINRWIIQDECDANEFMNQFAKRKPTKNETQSESSCQLQKCLLEYFTSFVR